MDRLEVDPIRGKMVEKGSITSERPGDFYLSLLGLERNKLKGKSIFNIGAGGSDLQSDLNDDDIKVVNFDFRYRDGNHRGVTKSSLIAADMFKLPFTANSTDIAVGLYIGGDDKKYLDLFLVEDMVRVAREEVVVYPCTITKDFTDYIEQHGLRDIVRITLPKFDIKLILANVKNKNSIYSKVSRIIKNIYYLGIEAYDTPDKSTRLSINTEALKKTEGWQKILGELLHSGFTIIA